MAVPVAAKDIQLDQITDNLYLSAATAITQDKLRSNGIKLIINFTEEIPVPNFPGIESMKINIEDTPECPISPHFDKCADKIKSARDKGGHTLVYCAAGMSRSASVCLAYLIKHHRMNLKDSYSLVKSRRPCIRPNPGFFGQLVEYERKIFGSITVTMVSSPDGLIPDLYKDDPGNVT